MNLHSEHEKCKSNPKGNLVRLVTASSSNKMKRTNLKICNSCNTIVKLVQVEYKSDE